MLLYYNFISVVVTEESRKMLAFNERESEMQNWRGTEGKLELIKEKWGNEVPDYLWFDLGNFREIGQVVILRIVEMFYTEHIPSFGDIELHRSEILPESTLLRIRDADKLHLTFTVNDIECPLYQVGYGGLFADSRVICFWQLQKKWEKAQKQKEPIYNWQSNSEEGLF